MIICKRCYQSLRSRGEASRCSNVTTEILEELNKVVLWGDYDENGEFVPDDDKDIIPYAECELCDEGDNIYPIDELKEV